jgi:DNA-directed RNA polymerase III subunit RPC1
VCRSLWYSLVFYFQGVVRLTLPVFHVGYFKLMITVLQNICKTCSRSLLEEDTCRSFLSRIRNPNIDDVQRKEVLKALNAACKKVSVCPHCAAINGSIKKIGALKVIHEKFKKKKKTTYVLYSLLISTVTRENSTLHSIMLSA